MWTLESKKIEHEQIDIGDPNREKDRQFMRDNADAGVDKAKTVLPPQIFNDEEYVGVSIYQTLPVLLSLVVIVCKTPFHLGLFEL